MKGLSPLKKFQNIYRRMLRKVLLSAASTLVAAGAFAQTFTGGGGPIHDLTTIDIPLTVIGLIPANIDTIGFGLESVCIDLTHTYDSDLEISLVSPDGTTTLLVAGQGGGGHDFTNTCFTDTSALGIWQGSAPFTGVFRPQSQMGVVNNQQNGNGTWFLRVTDTYGADTGYVNSWSITFGNNPATAQIVSATDLPLVILNTQGQSIPNDPKIAAYMGIIDNGPGMLNHVNDSFNSYEGWIGIEVRGNSSQSFPQKQYAFETWDQNGGNLDTMLLGMPKEHDWILYGPYSDKSCMRNWLSYALSNDMGQYAVRGRYCEVILNGSYQGIYEITETIKRDGDRVDIAKLTLNDTIGDDLTGGYIAKIDWIGGPSWQSNFLPDQTNPSNNVINFQLVSPKAGTLLPVQQAYIEAYIDSFETALDGPFFQDTTIGWRHFGNERSFVDYFLLNELAKNVDAYWLSTYFYKDKDSKGGKITMGPSWDFNGAWRGADYCNAPEVADWHYNEPDYCACDMPFWWKRLVQDTLFTNNLQCRWTELRSNVLDTAHIFHYIDSVATLLNQAQVRHFRQWQILGTYVWPNPSPLANTFQEELDYMKQWIIGRLAWIDANLPGTCYPPVVGVAGANTGPHLRVYPNPSAGQFHVVSGSPIEEVTVTDLLGKVLMISHPDAAACILEVQTPGVYFVNVLSGGVLQTKKLTVTR
ncbi:MAG: CotH kinase family protein [Bacteroidetes bacterium]|nr:CotH kinase family protein [Bacteroidota bacterium]